MSNFISTPPLVFDEFSLISIVFIINDFHEYANKIVIMLDH